MKKKGQHKERVTLTISLEGIRIEDETTQVSVQISQILAELTEHSPIIIQISSDPSSRKNWMYDHTTVRPYNVLLATCVANCTTGTPTPRLCPVVQWSVHWAPCRTTRARHWKKNASSAFRLG